MPGRSPREGALESSALRGAASLAAARRRRGRRLSDAMFGGGLALPAVVATLVLIAYPLLYSFWVSLHEVILGATEWQFVGLDNYTSVIDDPLFWPSLRRTLLVAAGITVFTPLLGLSFALALNERFRGRGVLRGVLILPWSLSQVMLALTFGWMFNTQFGPINGLVSTVGAEPVTWFASGTTVLVIITGAMIWNLVPFTAVLFLGSLQTVSEDLMRAARVDGAKVVGRFLLVTFPAIKDTLLVVIVLAALNGFLVFAPIYILTGGGPGTDTTLLAWWGYRTGFRDLELGESAAIFYLMTVLIAAISALTVFVLGRRRDA